MRDKEVINYVLKYQLENGYSKKQMSDMLDIPYNSYCKVMREERIPSFSSAGVSLNHFYKQEEEKKQIVNIKNTYGLECTNEDLNELKKLHCLFVKNKTNMRFEHEFIDDFPYTEKDKCFALRLIQRYGIVIEKLSYIYQHKFDGDSYSRTNIIFSYNIDDVDKFINYIESINIK